MIKINSLILGLCIFIGVVTEFSDAQSQNENRARKVEELENKRNKSSTSSKRYMTPQEQAIDEYASELADKRKEEVWEIISMLKTTYSDFLNGEYDRSPNSYKEKNSRKKHIDIFLGQLDSEVFDIKELIRKEQHNDKSQQEIFTLLKIAFIAKHLIGKACYDEFRKGDNNKLVITEKEFLEKYAQEFFKVKNLFQYVDQLQDILMNSYKKGKTAEERSLYMENALISIANDFFKKQKANE